MPRSKSDTIDFEKSLDQLNQLVEQMEKGELSLQQSLKNFEQGVKLIRECQKALTQAEQKVKILTEQSGQTQLTDYLDDESTND